MKSDKFTDEMREFIDWYIGQWVIRSKRQQSLIDARKKALMNIG